MSNVLFDNNAMNLMNRQADNIVNFNQILSSYSSTATFLSDDWFIDKYFTNMNIPINRRHLKFHKYSDGLKSFIKSFTLKGMVNNLSIDSLQKDKNTIWNLFKSANVLCIDDLSPKMISDMYFFICESNICSNTASYKWNILSRFILLYREDLYSYVKQYHFTQIHTYSSDDERYISDYVSTQMDRVMKNEDIPVTYRLAYWLLRLYPARATESFSYNLDCILPYHDTVYMMKTAVTKTAGNESGVPRILLIDKSEETQSYLLDLIFEQIEISKSIINLNDLNSEKLFWHYIYRNKCDQIWYKSPRAIGLLNVISFNRILKKIVKHYDITDENNNLAHVTTHMFRHNASTDRIESHIFRPIDLRPMTLHNNEEMLNKHYHKKGIASQLDLYKKVNQAIEKDTLLFNGKIINSPNPQAFEYFIKKPFAFKINHMGICVDNRECSKDKFACLGCKFFIPECNDLDYYVEQREILKQKLELAQKLNQPYYADNLSAHIIQFDKIINKIKIQLAKEGEN